MSVAVIKLGGNEVDDPAWMATLTAAIARRGGGTVLVHGGGKEITELQRVLGVEPEWRDGLRVTSEDGMRAVAMVLSGLVNKRIASALLTAGVDALGVSGEDGALIEADVARGGAMGRIGTVRRVRADLLHTLLAQGITPVVSPVSRGPDGRAMNVNADDAASAVAAAMEAGELLFVSNVPGVLREGSVLGAVAADEVEGLIEDGTAAGGMAPKLRAAARAAAGGVGAVRIGGVEMLGDASAGTRVHAPRTETAGTAPQGAWG